MGSGLQLLIVAGLAGVAFTAASPQLESIWSQATLSAEEIAKIEQSAYYPNCDDARSAGVAPIHRGRPGYREEMDGDGDGIACEPYYGR